MTKEDIKTIIAAKELQIRYIKNDIKKLNPFYELNDMGIQEFGLWSEAYVLSQVSTLRKENSVGRDIIGDKLGRIEVKSTRNWGKSITFNQLKPQYSDYHLFVCYDIENIDVHVFLIPNDKLIEEFSMSHQHEYTEEGGVFNMGFTTKANFRAAQKYKVTWEQLTELA